MNIMKLIVMRHGEAEASNTSDKTRNLTAYGRRQAKEAGKWLKIHVLDKHDVDVALVSPFLRAQQTYDCLNTALKIKQKVDIAELVPNAKAKAMHLILDGFLHKHPTLESVILVSHMPLVSFLLDELLLSHQASLFDTSSMAIIDYDINTSSGVLRAFYHPCVQQFEFK
jgi:phosphohistidine phosphatase